MPDHHLHSYFRYLVDHPELLHSESDGNSQDERKNAGSESNNSNGVAGALSLLGSVYGSGEEEDGDDTAKMEKDFTKESINAVSTTVSRDSKESIENAFKDESVSRNPIFSNKDKVPAVKKNSLIMASKPKGTKKEDNSGLFSAAAEKYDVGVASKIEPLIIEPPPEMKKLIDKIVEFISRNGKQFEATLIEQDSEHVKFPFLHPSNHYHPYYLKVLQKAQESKVNGKSSYPGKEDPVGRGTNKKASVLKRNESSSSASDLCDLPLESDRKEKFKMVIGKSKKEAHETEFSGAQESGVMVDAAAAAAILHAATRGINRSESGQPARLGSLPPSGPDNVAEMSEQGRTKNIGRTAASQADSSVTNMTEEQKLKAERLKRAKMFVAMLKSGAVPSKTGVSRGSSLEPLEPGVLRSSGEVSLTCQEKEDSLGPAVDKPAAIGYLGERPSERLPKRKYRSRSGRNEDDNEDEDNHRDMKQHDESHSKKRYKATSRSRRQKEDGKIENAAEEYKHDGRRHWSHSSEESEKGGESSEEEMNYKHHKSVHRSHRSKHEDDGCEDVYKEEKDHKRSRKKHRSRHSSRDHYSSEENENRGESSEEDRDHKHDKLMHRSHHSQHKDDWLEEIDEENDHKQSSKKHRSHRSSHDSSRKRHSSKQRKKHRSSHRSSRHHSRDKHRHKNVESSRGKDSQRLKHDSSSDEHHSGSDQLKKDPDDARGELEEGEIIPRDAGNLESSQQRASSQPSETTGEVPDDFRVKIRAMLMATRL